MRAFVSIFLFLLFLSQTFSSFVIDSAYWLNKNYVAETLCVNKNNPQLHCNGKCFLSKQIEKDGRDAAQPAGAKKECGNEVYFMPVVAPLFTQALFAGDPSYPQRFLISFPSYHHSLLRPPQLAFV